MRCGAQTERIRQFFAIGQQRTPQAIMQALGEIKRVCAGAELTHMEPFCR